MAGRIPPTKAEITAAIKAYLGKHDGIACEYKQDDDCYELTDANGKGAIVGPGWQCNDEGLFNELREILMAQRESTSPPGPARGTNLAVRGSEKGNTLAPRRNGANAPMEGSAIEAVRQCQSTEKATYSTGKGRKAASAKTNIAALMEMGGSLHIRDRIHKQDYIEYQVSASMGDQVVESGISIYKQEYLAKKAWEWIVKVLMDEPGIVTGTDKFGMPEFREGAQIKVRISDETQSVLVPLPAKIALWREMAREWQVAGRVCETKAYSRAADMLLRGDFQSKEELVEEQSEVRAIQEKEVAEVA